MFTFLAKYHTVVHLPPAVYAGCTFSLRSSPIPFSGHWGDDHQADCSLFWSWSVFNKWCPGWSLQAFLSFVTGLFLAVFFNSLTALCYGTVRSRLPCLAELKHNHGVEFARSQRAYATRYYCNFFFSEMSNPTCAPSAVHMQYITLNDSLGINTGLCVV